MRYGAGDNIDNTGRGEETGQFLPRARRLDKRNCYCETKTVFDVKKDKCPLPTGHRYVRI